MLRKTAARGTAVTQRCQEMFARFWGGNNPPQKKRKKKMLNMSNSKPRELLQTTSKVGVAPLLQSAKARFSKAVCSRCSK